MRITAAVAALALASSGCATCAMATLASVDPHSDEEGPLLVIGSLVDGIAMTSLGAGALDGHSSVGWSRGEGEWAMAGGITLLAIDALVIGVEVVRESRGHEAAARSAPAVAAPAAPAPPVEPSSASHAMTVHAHWTEQADDDVYVVFQKTVRQMPRVGYRYLEQLENVGFDAGPLSGPSVLLEPGEYRACAIYGAKAEADSPAEAVSCTTFVVGDQDREVTIPPP